MIIANCLKSFEDQRYFLNTSELLTIRLFFPFDFSIFQRILEFTKGDFDGYFFSDGNLIGFQYFRNRKELYFNGRKYNNLTSENLKEVELEI